VVWEAPSPSDLLEQQLDAAAINAVALHNQSDQGVLDQPNLASILLLSTA
jgi:hypothetical protein